MALAQEPYPWITVPSQILPRGREALLQGERGGSTGALRCNAPPPPRLHNRNLALTVPVARVFFTHQICIVSPSHAFLKTCAFQCVPCSRSWGGVV